MPASTPPWRSSTPVCTSSSAAGPACSRPATWSSTPGWTGSTLPPRSTSRPLAASRPWWHGPSTTPGSDSASPGPVPRSGRSSEPTPEEERLLAAFPREVGHSDEQTLGALAPRPGRAWQGRLRPGPRLAVRCEPRTPGASPGVRTSATWPGACFGSEGSGPLLWGVDGRACPSSKEHAGAVEVRELRAALRRRWYFLALGAWSPPSSASPPRPAPAPVRSSTRPPTPCSRTPPR